MQKLKRSSLWVEFVPGFFAGLEEDKTLKNFSLRVSK